ncbi:hypothetical protein DXG01_014468 [Tephrocybe rancida]|nr:hypothetical protein DXG01_014468 [Tephrocybe rancida]
MCRKKASPVKKKTPGKAKSISKSVESTEVLDLTSNDDGGASKLEHVDSTYRSAPKSHALPASTGLNTQAKTSAKRQMVADSPDRDQSPQQETKPAKKKPRSATVRADTPVEDSAGEDGGDSDNFPESPSKLSKAKGKGRVAPVASSILSHAPVSDQEDVAINSDEVPEFKPTKTKGSTTFKSAPDPDTESDVTLDSVSTLTVTKLLLKCQVSKHGIDKTLADIYVNLSNLVTRDLLTWNPLTGGGFMWFSEWPQLVPDIDMGHAKAAMSFVSSGRYVNLALVSPKKLSALLLIANGDRKSLQVGKEFAVCIRAIHAATCHLITPPTRKEGLMVAKYISGTPHSYDFARLSAVFCMAFHEWELHAQLSLDKLSFQTKTNPAQSGFTTPKKKAIHTFKSPVKVSSHAGPSAPTPITSFFPSVLDFNAGVPIYDARGVPVDYQKDLPFLVDRLPPFSEGEVPNDSFAVVGYSASTYKDKKSRINLSLNVLFVIVIGTP